MWRSTLTVRRWALLVLTSFVLSLLPSAVPTQAQSLDAPDVASYTMDVQLDPAAKTVAGTGRITYNNPSQDTLNELWLRLYLKAFSSTDTLWMRESGGQLRGDQMDPDELGDITVQKLAIVGGPDVLASTTLTDTLMRVPLAEPLVPGGRIELDVAWESKLPRVFARTGYGGRDDTFFMVGQWYPKMAVYDRGSWDTEPWHANSEFFNDFGNYDVSITVPEAYVVAGAGVPAGEQAGSGGTKTLRFTSENVTDFAFAASPDFKTATAQARAIDVDLFYLPEHASLVQEYLDSSVESLTTFGEWFGPYPHPRLTVVDVPDDATGAGGMEYPTLVTGESGGGVPGFVAYVTSHEIGHQWWPMQTATNEGAEPWLDEGLTEYSGARYVAEAGRRLGGAQVGLSARAFERSNYLFSPEQPASLPAWEYDSGNYGIVYSKTALGLWTLENQVGSERFFAAMRTYLEAYRFKHPTGEDFRRSIEGSLGPQPWFFDVYMPTEGVIDYGVERVGGEGVVIRRDGDVPAQVDIRVTLAGGERIEQVWDGKDAELAIPVQGQVAQVEIDPLQKLAAETDLEDNFETAQPQVLPALTLGQRLASWLQIIVQSLGMFG